MSVTVSVIIPCYKQAHLLGEAVQSVLEQTYPDWECIIVNDGSPDLTAEVAKAFCQQDTRIKYISKENGGLSSARNAGLDAATGDYIQFLDADDRIYKNKFLESIEGGVGADIVITDFILFTTGSKLMERPSFQLNKFTFNFETILSNWDSEFVIPIHCGIFKKSLFVNTRFNEKLKAKEDWMLWLQLYLNDVTTVYIDKPYALYRYVSDSMSKKRALMNESQVMVFKALYPLIPVQYQAVFFDKVIRTLGKIITDTEDLLSKTRASKSFRIGNFFVRHFNLLTGKK